MAQAHSDQVLVWMVQILHQAARFELALPGEAVLNHGTVPDREAMRAAGLGQYSLPPEELQTRRIVLDPASPPIEMEEAPDDLDETAFILPFKKMPVEKSTLEKAPD